MDTNIQNTFLALIRLGIGHPICERLKEIRWEAVEALALQQGLSAVVVDGIEQLPEHLRPPKDILLQWIGETLQGYEYRFELYRNTIAEMSGFYNQHGYKLMVLKGYACSVNWPTPEHRPCGDIDIWQFGKQKEADDILVKEKGIKIDKSHHHHTVFEWNDFTVENHYDFINTLRHKSHKDLEALFKELGSDDTHTVEVLGEKVYLPSPNLHALFLIRHALNHFVSIGINLRQVLDWAFFVEKYTKEVNWDWLLSLLDKYHMREFFNCINAICVEDLGFDPKIFPFVQFSPFIKDKVFNDIISPEYTLEDSKGILKRYIHKYKRWKGNAWKQELCFDESRWSAFWSGVGSLFMKP